MRQVFADGEPGSVLESCLAAAVAAPSVHNSQPWLFHPCRGSVDVYADRDRQLPVIDPDGRELFMSVGAAIFNLRLAVLCRGRRPELRLLPDPDAPDLLARITPGGPARPSTTMRALADAITRRRSNRWPFTDLAVPTVVQAELIAAATAEGAALVVAGPAFRRTVLGAVRDAGRRQCADVAYRRELAEWTRPTRGRRDGIPSAAAGARPADDTVPLRDVGPARPVRHGPTMTFEARPTVAVLYTADTPRGWVRAGQALQRVLLTATVRGLSTTLLTQPLEIRRFRDELTDPVSGRAPQAIVRLGYTPRIPASSPRRTLSEVLITAGPDRAVRCD